jgi:hypothetical protein
MCFPFPSCWPQPASCFWSQAHAGGLALAFTMSPGTLLWPSSPESLTCKMRRAPASRVATEDKERVCTPSSHVAGTLHSFLEQTWHCVNHTALGRPAGTKPGSLQEEDIHGQPVLSPCPLLPGLSYDCGIKDIHTSGSFPSVLKHALDLWQRWLSYSQGENECKSLINCRLPCRSSG